MRIDVTKKYTATIRGARKGIREADLAIPGIWFYVHYDDGLAALIMFITHEADQFLAENSITDIQDLNGRQCIIEVRSGIVSFVALLDKEEQ
jgi:hypothetical protein